METLKNDLNNLVQKTLIMDQQVEDYMTILQSQPMPESENEVESQQDQIKENQNSSKNHIVSRHRIRYTAIRIKYSPTRIKSRNFLSNISYTDINKKDFYNENFILDIFVLLVKNLNSFSLSRKVSDKRKHEMVYMIWRECILVEFYRYICEENNFIYLNGREVGHPGVLEIVGKFIDQKKENLRILQEYLARYKDIYQYVYSHIFPEVYTTSERRSFDLKSNFHILFKSYQDKQLMRQHATAKNLSKYEDIKKEANEYEQKPIKNFDSFNDQEENEIKEKAQKRLAEKKIRAEENKAKKHKERLEEDKLKESEMWERSNELNSQFKKIKTDKNTQPKKKPAIL